MESVQPPDFRTIFLTVRPPKVAVLIDSDDVYWQSTCSSVLDFFSLLWGGHHNLIIPTNGSQIDEIFLDILEAFDPDYILSYWYSGKDLQRADEKKFENWVSQQQSALAAEFPNWPESQCLTEAQRLVSEIHFSKFHVESALQETIAKRLAPFHFQDMLVQHHVTADSDSLYFLTSLKDILPHCKHPTVVTQYTTKTTRVPQLWIEAQIGSGSERYADRMREAGISVFRNDLTDENLYSSMETFAEWFTSQTPVPFSLASTQLSYYQYTAFHDWEVPSVAIFGDTLADFCFFQCLSRLRERVRWLPHSLIDETSYRGFLTSAVMHLRSLSRQTGVLFASRSLTTTQLEQIRDEIHITNVAGDVTLDFPLQKLLLHPRSVLERHSTSRPFVGQFTGNDLAGFVPTPKPQNFDQISPTKHNWITELQIKDYQPPRHAKLGQFYVSAAGVGTMEARTSRDGLAYPCPTNGMYFGGGVDEVLVRPALHLLTAADVLERICGNAHYSTRISDKGFYAAETIAKFGSLDQTASFLRDQKKRAFLEKYLDTGEPSMGVFDQGAFVQGRRYLDYASASAILMDSVDPAALLDDFTVREILYRGYVFQCTYCRNSDWYALSDVSDSFTCSRCRRNQVFTTTNWKRPHEPALYYKLDEIVYQALRNNCTTPVLALDALRKAAKRTPFAYCHDHYVYRASETDPWFEIDFGISTNGEFLLGEAKTDDRLAPTAKQERSLLEKYKTLAEACGVKTVVLATLAPAWSQGTLKTISESFAASTVKPKMLCAADLLQDS